MEQGGLRRTRDGRAGSDLEVELERGCESRVIEFEPDVGPGDRDEAGIAPELREGQGDVEALRASQSRARPGRERLARLGKLLTRGDQLRARDLDARGAGHDDDATEGLAHLDREREARIFDRQAVLVVDALLARIQRTPEAHHSVLEPESAADRTQAGGKILRSGAELAARDRSRAVVPGEQDHAIPGIDDAKGLAHDDSIAPPVDARPQLLDLDPRQPIRGIGDLDFDSCGGRAWSEGDSLTEGDLAVARADQIHDLGVGGDAFEAEAALRVARA
ncbi:MAG: hypothetical protein JRJ58_20475 [Deltaproteobacteria bacterium]|nr:hypothetical protein [Deltaproteobacteria bacterium]